jgi:PAS domain S-box-containing protein
MPRTETSRRLIYFITFAIIITLLFGPLLYALYLQKFARLEEEMISAAQRHIAEKKQQIKLELAAAGMDLEYLSDLIASHNAPPLQTTSLEAMLKRFARSHPAYLQMRYIDSRGMEVVRIDNLLGKPVVADSSTLQYKHNRYYLQESRNLAPGAVYISEFDLNVEHQKISMPRQPVLRLVKQIVDGEGALVGYAVLNYSGTQIINTLKSHTHGLKTLLLNKEGYYLIGFKPENEWGFMLGRDEMTFSKEHETAWHVFAKQHEGFFNTPEQLFVFSHFHPEHAINHSDKRFNRDWTIVNTIDVAALRDTAEQYARDLFRILLPYYLLGVISCWFLARYIVQFQQARLRIKIAHQAFENAHEGIMVTTPDAKIVQVNRGFSLITGYNEKDVIGKNANILRAHEAQNRDFYQQMWQTLTSSGTWNGELWNQRQDGSRYLEALTISSIRDDNDGTLYYIAIFTDITRHKRQEAQLREQIQQNEAQHQKMLKQSRLAQMGEMVAMIAHQWRQPLASISAIAGTLTIRNVIDEYDKSFFYEQLESISELSGHLSSTIDDFRYFFQENKQKSRISMREIVQSSIELIKPTLDSHSITLEITSHTDIEIETYPNEVKQVILNILKNADDALLEKRCVDPRIWVRCEEDANRVYLYTEDNAGGIPETYLQQVFEPSFSTKTENGTGLGLYMSKTMIEKHCHGSLEVTNTDRGARFTIALPKALPGDIPVQ